MVDLIQSKSGLVLVSKTLLMNIYLIIMKIKTKIAAQNYEVADCENLGNHLADPSKFSNNKFLCRILSRKNGFN
jgi:ABC-type transport system involved in cytochrome bd biosynthesis fused ATPase/permease subunit